MGFSSPIVEQFRNPHSYSKDFADEADLYSKADLLLTTLAQWTSDQHRTLDEAYLALTEGLSGSHHRTCEFAVSRRVLSLRPLPKP